MWSRNPIPVLMVICCVGVNWVACAASLNGTMPFFAASASWGSEGAGKCLEGSNGGRMPPSKERETWILVSLVSRESVAVRAGRGMVDMRTRLEDAGCFDAL